MALNEGNGILVRVAKLLRLSIFHEFLPFLYIVLLVIFGTFTLDNAGKTDLSLVSSAFFSLSKEHLSAISSMTDLDKSLFKNLATFSTASTGFCKHKTTKEYEPVHEISNNLTF